MKNLTANRKIEFIKLKLEYMEFRSRLRSEFPEEVLKMDKDRAISYLQNGLIKCQHDIRAEFENKVKDEGLKEVEEKLYDFERRLVALEPTA